MKVQIKVQQNLMKGLVCLPIVLLFLSCSLAFGYNTDSHYQITVKAVDKSSLNDALQQMGFTDYNDSVKGSSKIKSIIDWIGYGSQWEDGIALYDYGVFDKRGILYCHFYNPITNKGYTNSGGEEIGQSLIDRADDSEINIKGFLMNEWSYQMAKDLYYAALTGYSMKYPQWIMRDGLTTASFIGKENMNAKEREQFFAWTFQALGHTVHLIEDASVPAHTRNDLHGTVLGIGDPEPYEDWTKSKAKYAKNNPNDTFFPSILDGYGSESWNPLTHFDENTIVKSPDIFIDSGKLVDASTPPITDLNQGLAEYSHANFLSKDTVLSNDSSIIITPVDGLSDLGLDDIGEVVTEEDREIANLTYKLFYVKNNTAQIDHFALCGIAWQIKQMGLLNGLKPETRILYTVDDPLVNEDYAKKLLPRAVGYGAGLLDYFFRGRLEVSALPIFVDNELYGIRLKIKNATPTEEDMTMSDQDRLVLVCRYTPPGANEDGSEDIFVMADSYRCIKGDCDAKLGLDGIQNGKEATIDFHLPEDNANRIGMQLFKSDEKSVKCMFVFKGKLGQEESAVIGKYFTLGRNQVKFNEEWDNGPTGNYPWVHTTADQNPDNGATYNQVMATDTSSNSLIKENVRYAGYDNSRINETFVDFNDVITPHTYLLFKIDDLSKTETSTFHWQALVLNFNEGRFLQLTRSGQALNMNDTTVSHSFELGARIGLNIFEIFQNDGISIPDPFYIESISFIQQLYEESEPTTAETKQHMEVDYIRLIEENYEQ